ncbi:MAG TPA: protocatechuate 3,4-dioxygenase subunit alpha [Rhizomicrobium sp.]|jgi:protocatechuate 3,4-dioxygenase, alpha subunit|nr:protocatechuate 3,4-dioxygenase subunit alpha [Rhizomicrobium sp.]
MDNQSKELFGQTPWQTVGPFFHYGLPWKGGADLTGISELGARTDLMPPEHCLLREPAARGIVEGEKIEIFGRVLDGDGQPVPDAMIEIWHADAHGRYYAPGTGAHFLGFGRAATGNGGDYRFRTILPGRVPGPGNTLQAPHVAVGVFARGLLKRLVTRIYFPDREGLETDPVLELVPPERRDTLIARREPGGYRFDLALRGAGETVFFDC